MLRSVTPFRCEVYSAVVLWTMPLDLQKSPTTLLTNAAIVGANAFDGLARLLFESHDVFDERLFRVFLALEEGDLDLM
jgi:hypothetical protein